MKTQQDAASILEQIRQAREQEKAEPKPQPEPLGYPSDDEIEAQLAEKED